MLVVVMTLNLNNLPPAANHTLPGCLEANKAVRFEAHVTTCCAQMLAAFDAEALQMMHGRHYMPVKLLLKNVHKNV